MRSTRLTHEDPNQLRRIETLTWYSRQQPVQIVQLDEDERTYDRKPTLAQSSAQAGSRVPRAEQGQGSNTTRRIAACPDPHTGQLLGGPRAEFGRHTLLRFSQFIEQRSPKADQLVLIQDHWPVQWHPDVVQGLRESNLTLVALPTYAPWLTPVEQVWRKPSAEVLPLHPWTKAWEHLPATVQAWLDPWLEGSLGLLRYVGLCPD